MKTVLEPTYRTRVQSLMGIEELAKELGQDLAPMLAKFGLSVTIMSKPDAYIQYSVMCGLLEACAIKWNCPDFGLRLARLQNLNFLGPVGLVVRLATTVEEALATLTKHLAIHTTGFHSYIEEQVLHSGGQASMVFVPKPGTGAGRQVVEHSLYVTCNILSMLTGSQSFKPSRVSFQYSAPENPSTVRRFFNCAVSYNDNLNAIHFDAKVLRAPNAVRDIAYASLIEDYVEKLQSQLNGDIVISVKNLIGNFLPTGKCSLATIAECYRIHPRTLQRRLLEQGISFAEILDDYRKALAMDLVSRQSMSLVRVADVLGYSDQSAFNQAFRRWTETTPTRFVRQKPMNTPAKAFAEK